MRRAHAGQTPWHDLAAFRNELCQQPDVFVVNRFKFLYAKFADFLAPEKLPPAGSTLAPAWAWRPALSAVTIAKRPFSACRTLSRGTISRRCCCCRCFSFFSHDAPSFLCRRGRPRPCKRFFTPLPQALLRPFPLPGPLLQKLSYARRGWP